MSSAKGNSTRKRAQKYQNTTVYKNNLHDKTNVTKFLNSMEISGVCKRCKDVIQWKIKYKKYKILSAPSKCVGCEMKTVKHAYHILCCKCASMKGVCSKCMKKIEEPEDIKQVTDDTKQDADIQHLLKTLSERKRRTLKRQLEKGKMQSSELEDMLSKMANIGSDSDDFSDSAEEFQSDDE